VNYLRGAFSLGSVRLNGSRVFSLWSKYFAGISDSRVLGVNKNKGSCENKSENNKTIIATIFRLLFCYFFPRNITRSLLVILA
jgi:hypothetical protein